MNIHGAPEDEKDIVDIIAKTGYLKAENDQISVSLDSSDTLNIQPKGTPFGMKIKAEEDGSITPTLTFDTKKTREKPNFKSEKEVVDQALKDFFGE